jgi:hypothetical protein
MIAARRGLVVGLLVSALLGCASAPPHATRARAIAKATDTWDASSWEERHDTMSFVVLPNMARLFQRFEGTQYPELTCRSCHGRDADQVAFAMLHTLVPLDPKHLPDPRSSDPREARIAKFMTDEVTPTFAKLIDAPPDSVSCFSCHVRKETQP